MTLDLSTLLAILAMAIATALIRLSGLVLIRYVKLSARAREALTAIPPAVLMAVVAPTALMTGVAETIGCALTAFAALRLPLLGATAIGVACVALLRLAGL